MENIMRPPLQEGGRHYGRIIGGIAVILVGLSMLADRAGFDGVHLSGRDWPLILVAIGLLRLADVSGQPAGRRRWRGAWLVYVGCWGLLNEFHVFGLDYGTSWPLLVVGAGVAIVWRAFAGRPGPVREG
jgi:hypothetical protein